MVFILSVWIKWCDGRRCAKKKRGWCVPVRACVCVCVCATSGSKESFYFFRSWLLSSDIVYIASKAIFLFILFFIVVVVPWPSRVSLKWRKDCTLAGFKNWKLCFRFHSVEEVYTEKRITLSNVTKMKAEERYWRDFKTPSGCGDQTSVYF